MDWIKNTSSWEDEFALRKTPMETNPFDYARERGFGKLARHRKFRIRAMSATQNYDPFYVLNTLATEKGWVLIFERFKNPLRNPIIAQKSKECGPN